MKKIFVFAICNILCIQIASSQTAVSQGKPITDIFTEFHYNMNDSLKTTGFGINRAYLGYKYQPEGNFYATVEVNIGSPEDLAAGAVHRRYAYFREASLSYSKDKLNMSFGITSTRLWIFQQNFWGKRYLANTFESNNGYGYVADLGFVLDYKFNDYISADFTLMNGEGYSEVQLNNALKTSVGFIITPVKKMVIRLYGDIYKPNGVLQTTLIGFVGYKNDLITIGGEADFKSSLDMIQGHNAWGISATGGIKTSAKTEIFARYDYSTSVIMSGDSIRWNYKKDGSFAIFGVQYTFTPNVQLALDYQDLFPRNPDKQDTHSIYLNLHFKF